MKILGIASIVYGVEDVEAGARFFKDWGLECNERSAGGADFVLASGQTLLVRPMTDSALPPAVEGGSTAREIAWAVGDAAGLEEIAAELSRDREVKTDSEGTVHTLDPNGIPVAFRVLPLDTSHQFGPASIAEEGPPVRPRQIAHAVYSVTKARAAETVSFYMERLQFRASDRVKDNGVFLRASGARDHHNFFAMHRADRLAFNHTAFELAEWDEVMAGGKFMMSRGWETAIEPGSHFLSSQRYWYFHCPCGGHAEYFTGAKLFDDTWETRVWDTVPRVPASN